MTKLWGLLALFMIPMAVAAAGAPAPKLPHFDFENGVEGWTPLSGVGQVLPSATPAHVRTGQLALAYRYEAKPGELPILGVPVEGLAGMGSLRLDVSTDSPTLLLVALVEEGQARYQYVTATPAQGWMHLEIDRSEFVRAEDTPDPDNRLDLDQVRTLVFADLRAILTAQGGGMAKLYGPRTGQHTLWLDNLAAGPQSVASPSPEGRLRIDDFRRENLGWMPLEGVALSTGPAPGGALGRALRLDYTTGAGKLAAILRPLQPGTLTGSTRLTFAAAAEHNLSLAVVLEETGGARYVGTVSIAGGGLLQPVSVSFAALKLAEDTKDADGRLDLEQVKSLGFVDLAGLAGAPPPGKSVLWLAEVQAIRTAGK